MDITGTLKGVIEAAVETDDTLYRVFATNAVIVEQLQETNTLLEQILKELQNGKESRIEQEKKPQEKTPEVSSKPVGSYDERPEVQHDPGGF